MSPVFNLATLPFHCERKVKINASWQQSTCLVCLFKTQFFVLQVNRVRLGCHRIYGASIHISTHTTYETTAAYSVVIGVVYALLSATIEKWTVSTLKIKHAAFRQTWHDAFCDMLHELKRRTQHHLFWAFCSTAWILSEGIRSRAWLAHSFFFFFNGRCTAQIDRTYWRCSVFWAPVYYPCHTGSLAAVKFDGS